ncbi:Cysteine-rich receptor-like protein kinase 25 [Bienertia sinuspersici]
MSTSFLPELKLIFVFLISFPVVTNAQLTYIYHYCDDIYGNYSLSSNYGDNIKSAITTLASNASTSYYNNHTTGVNEDKVNAFFYCRYDISPQVCRNCVEDTRKHVSRCHESLISYEECTVYYSNRSIISVVEDLDAIYTYDLGNVTADREVHFSQYLENVVTQLITNVTSEFGVSKRYFATTSSKYSSHETLYALAQCNPDITSSRCKTCLRNGFDDLTYNSTGDVYGQFIFPGCRLSYVLSSEELSRPWKFAQTSDDQYLASTLTPRHNSATSTGIQGSSLVLALIASISSVALSLKLLI